MRLWVRVPPGVIPCGIRSYSVMVITLDSESSDPGSNPGRTSFTCKKGTSFTCKKEAIGYWSFTSTQPACNKGQGWHATKGRDGMQQRAGMASFLTTNDPNWGNPNDLLKSYFNPNSMQQRAGMASFLKTNDPNWGNPTQEHRYFSVVVFFFNLMIVVATPWGTAIQGPRRT